MKHKKRNLVMGLLVAILVLMNFIACTKKTPVAPKTTEEGMKGLVVNPSFNWSTTKEVDILVYAKDNSDEPLPYVRLDIMDGDPDDGGKTIVSGATDDQGVLSLSVTVPTSLESVYLISNYIGLANKIPLTIIGDAVNYTYGEESPFFKTNNTAGNALPKSYSMQVDEYRFLGGWDKNGVPDYLEKERDEISKDLLEDINTSLPECISILDKHPEFLTKVNDTNLSLCDECDIWVTFVHEGAGWLNGLGFYTYDLDSPPASAEDIKSITIIFPNVSFKHSGGGLKTGDKVYIGRFSKNVGIGWVLIANGWDGNTIGSGQFKLYSDPGFNPESDEDLQRHNVLLHDQEREIVLLGFEDVRRDGHCDNDFNDAVFYVTANPATAVETTNLSTLDDQTSEDDTDQDGVANVRDEYPDDPDKAFNNYYPSKDRFGTVAFEDLWPGTGDYDFNDLVIGYNVNHITNAKNLVAEVDLKFMIRAIGASYKNGFGFQVDVAAYVLGSVTGQKITSGVVQLWANQSEANQSKAVVIVFSNAYDLMTRPGGYFVNTELDAPYVEPDTIKINLKMRYPPTLDEMNYNPFIFVNQNRKKEVHLPDFPNTDLADVSYFGQSQDDSKPGSGRYYKTKNNLPWALDIPYEWKYPIEKVDITKAYYYFSRWAESGGIENPDWYMDISGNYDESLVYKK